MTISEEIPGVTQPTKVFIFIDECGDPNFYGSGRRLLVGQPGYQPLLIIGMISTENRKALRRTVLSFREKILGDPLYNSIPSIKNDKEWYLHAKDDHPEIRAKFFELIREIEGFKSFIVIGRKKIDLFNRKHNNSPTEFYFDLLKHLIKDRLNKEDVQYQVYLSQRGKPNMEFFQKAIEEALNRDNSRRTIPIKVNYKCDIVLSSQYPELSVIDYLLWALQRYIMRSESRFFNSIIDKYNLIIDLYDSEHYASKKNAHSNYYSRMNPFSLEKASNFEL
jgi:hypothetical protein